MKLMTHDPDHGPCPPMRPLLDAAADGRTKGFRTWYARLHAARCPGCRRYLESLQAIVQRLKGTHPEPTDEDEAALDRLRQRL